MSRAIYDLATGRILRIISCPDDLLPLNIREGESSVEVSTATADDRLFFVLDGEITPRPEFAESITGTTISNLPIPTTVIANGIPHEVDDGEADLTFSAPGTYQVRLVSFPYQDKTVEVTQP